MNKSMILNNHNMYPTRMLGDMHAEATIQGGITKRVESVLYDYPVWKINLGQLQPRYGGSIIQFRPHKNYVNPVEELTVLRFEHLSWINLIEATMKTFSLLQREFVKKRYFEKALFKNIAAELAVTERHLYRIRNEVIRLFAIAFGWQLK